MLHGPAKREPDGAWLCVSLCAGGAFGFDEGAAGLDSFECCVVPSAKCGVFELVLHACDASIGV